MDNTYASIGSGSITDKDLASLNKAFDLFYNGEKVVLQNGLPSNLGGSKIIVAVGYFYGQRNQMIVLNQSGTSMTATQFSLRTKTYVCKAVVGYFG